MDDKLRERVNGSAASALKKIIASKGKVKGNFYYVGSASGEDAGVVITLSTRDAKGTKAIVLGKQLRKDISGGKYGLGVVRIEGSKIIFEQSAGTISSAKIKEGFKKNLSQVNGLKFLSRAVVRKAGAPPVEEVDAANDPEATAAGPETASAELEEQLSEADFAAMLASMPAEEQKELEALGEEQETLDKSNSALTMAFSDAQSDDDILEHAIEESLSAINSLVLSHASIQEVQAARFQLAELMYIGDSPFPEVGGAIDAPMKMILSGATDEALGVLLSQHAKVVDEITDGYERLDAMAPGPAKFALAVELVGPLRAKRDHMNSYLSQMQNMKY
ncbi:MAG: hypothetical protein P8R54_27280 [Myxococcota bacterium]|nr:hypothetical protein [Myxococcota bacterium]